MIKNNFLFIIDWLSHYFLVVFYSIKFCIKLLSQSIKHDFSKLSKKERPFFVSVFSDFKKCSYGSKEYKRCAKVASKAIKHHFKHNRHHGIEKNSLYNNSFNMIDFVELYLDWKAAYSRNKNKNRTRVDNAKIACVQKNITGLTKKIILNSVIKKI